MNHPSRLDSRALAAARGAALGALTTGGLTAWLALGLVVLRPFLVTSAVLRAALCGSVAVVAVLGLLGGSAGACARPRGRWAASSGACALVGAALMAAYAWTGWDGQARGVVFQTGPLPWAARLPGLAMILGGAIGAGGLWRLAAPRLFERRPGVLWGLLAAGLVLGGVAAGGGALGGPRGGAERVVLFGVDGVGPELLRKMTEKTDLPSFERVLDESPCGPLLPEPPYSPPSWSTLATGKLPAKHGVDNWGRNNRGTGKRVNHSRSAIQAATIFDIAEAKGLGGAVFEWPIVGRESAGLDSPINRIAVLVTGFGDRLPWVLRQALHLRADRRKRIHLTYKENETGLVVLSHFFWNYTAARVFGLVIKSTDSAQHYYFHALDPERFGLDERGARERADHIPAIYRIADRILAGFLADPTTNVLVFSDHGAQGIPGDRAVHFNFAYRFDPAPLLEDWGYSVFDEEGEVDFGASRIYNCSDKVLHQQFCVNTTDERCEALGVGPEELLERGRTDIEALAEHFRSLRFEDEDRPLFPGPYTSRWNGRDMRETWLQMNQRGGEPVFFPNYDDYDLLLGAGFEIVPFSEALERRFVVDGRGGRWPLLELLEDRGWEGNHRRDGIVAGLGPAFRDAARIEGARTADIVPTALQILGLPVADDMDGRVLAAMLRPERAAVPPRSMPTYEG